MNEALQIQWNTEWMKESEKERGTKEIREGMEKR